MNGFVNAVFVLYGRHVASGLGIEYINKVFTLGEAFMTLRYSLLGLLLPLTALLAACQGSGQDSSQESRQESGQDTTQLSEPAEEQAEPNEPGESDELLYSADGVRTTLPVHNAATLKLVCDKAIAEAKKEAERLSQLPMPDISVETLLDPWDANGAQMEDGVYPIYLLANVSPDPAVREAGQECILKLSKFESEVYQNRGLYERFAALQTQTSVQAKYRQDLLHAFEDSGVALPEEQRERAKQISQEITALSQEFQKNIRENQEQVVLTPDEVAGMSEQWLESMSQDDDGNYLASFDYPVFYPFLDNATNDAARKRYLTAFTQRGGSDNLRLLDEIMQRRYELAQLHGLPSYAHLVTARRMVENPETVHNFLDEVASQVNTVEQQNLQELATLKAELIGEPEAKITRWDANFYKEKLKQKRYDIDQETLRQYFPTEASIQWAIQVAEKLYGIKMQPAFAPVWHPDVQVYEVFRNTGEPAGQYVGSIYLDPFPRDGKYKHAAAFPVRSASTRIERKPISVLVTNFNREGLTHREVETLFHEFGHVLHGVLSTTEYASQAGTSVSRDFVEAPSQMFEAWASRRESLDVLQNLCPECPVISDDMLARLQAAQNFGQGIHYARQHLYASFDMALVGPAPQPAQAVWVAMESATPLGHMSGTEFPGTFGHIAGGYASGYYGYMWSEVLAKDMLSAYGDNVMDSAVGQRYLAVILSQGGQRPAKALVEEFLGRPVNSKAFFDHITGK